MMEKRRLEQEWDTTSQQQMNLEQENIMTKAATDKKPKFKTVDEYFENQPEAAKKNLQALRAIIMKAAPEAEELINYDMPAFALAKGGKRDKQVMIAGYQDFVGFYTGTNILEHFAKELAEFKIGKASVQFPNNTTLPEDLIIKIVKFKIKSLK
jgi:uncharacterized protein YdhG (YjbR/CyaY superfamily)